MKKLQKILFWIISRSLILFALLFALFPVLESTSSFPGMGYEKLDMPIGEKITLKNSSGKNIVGLYIDNKSDTTIYYFHGNGGSINMFKFDILALGELGYNVLVYDYPGYGESEGFPFTSDVYEATQMFYDYSKEKYNYSKIIPFGYSIGSTQATHFAYTNQVDKLILMSPLSSRSDMAKKLFKADLYKILLQDDTFVNKEKIKNIDVPTLIIHGNSDKIVPFHMGKTLYENSPSKQKTFVEIDRFGHNGIIMVYEKQIKFIFENFINGYKVDNMILSNTSDIPYDKIKYDIKTDSSVYKFVNNVVHFDKLDYIPEVSFLQSENYTYRHGSSLRKESKDSLEKMSTKFYQDNGFKLHVVSSYRSYSYQKGIKDRGCSDLFCARAGYSEHQSGLAVDFFETSSEKQFLKKEKHKIFFSWMKENAHNFGFHNTYQRGVEIDGYVIEPWHWRYLGVDLSTHLKGENMTFAEYYNLKNTDGNKG